MSSSRNIDFVDEESLSMVLDHLRGGVDIMQGETNADKPGSGSSAESTDASDSSNDVVETISKASAGNATLAQYKTFSGLFSSLEDAEKFMYSKVAVWMPSRRGVPDDQTDAGKKKIRRCVKKLYNAITDMSSFNDKMPEAAKRCLSIMSTGRHTDADVEATAWRVVYTAIRLHTEGSWLRSTHDASCRADREFDFDERIDAICDTFKVWKACAQEAIEGFKTAAVVHAPTKSGNVSATGPKSPTPTLTPAQKKASNKRSNFEKCKALQAGVSQLKAAAASPTAGKDLTQSTAPAKPFSNSKFDEIDENMQEDWEDGSVGNTRTQAGIGQLAQAMKDDLDWESEKDWEPRRR